MKHLSRFDIEAIADKYVQAYMALPDVRNTQIYRIDPELNIYTDVTKELRKSEFEGLDSYFKNEYNKVSV